MIWLHVDSLLEKKCLVLRRTDGAKEMSYLELMRSGSVFDAFVPGSHFGQHAFSFGIIGLFTLATIDYWLGEDYRLHSLYLFPFVFVQQLTGIRCFC